MCQTDGQQGGRGEEGDQQRDWARKKKDMEFSRNYKYPRSLGDVTPETHSQGKARKQLILGN